MGTQEMTVIDNAMGRCSACGKTLKTVGEGAGFQIGPLASDVIDEGCADEIARLVLARQGRVSVLAEFRSDPVKYLTEHGFLDGRGRVKPEHLAATSTTKTN